MKYTCLMLTLFVFQSVATTYAQSTKIDLDIKQSTLKQVFKEIESKTEFTFFYNDEVVDLDRVVDIRARKESIEKILDRVLTNCTYKIENKNILLIPKKTDSSLPGILQNQRQITGIITDESGIPIIGANVVEKGTTNGIITDMDGKFSLSVSENAILQVSYIGYIGQEIKVANQTNISITLKEDTQALDEVVVIGYGTRTKGALTGSISKVNNEVFESRPLTNTISALQGAMPGVVITRNNGKPGEDGGGINVRGYSSLGGSNPLILIDGVSGSLNLINPNDIADITVLKDAAAAIYGARASDGVILVTTKKGNKGKPTLSFSGNVGIKKPSYLKQPVTLLHLAEMLDEGYTNIGMKGVSDEVMGKIKAGAEPDPSGGWVNGYESYPGFYRDTDWNNVIYGNGIQQMYNINVTGGGENNRYLFSTGYTRDNGLMKFGEHYSERLNIRMNYDFDIFDWLTIETRVHYENRRITEPSELSMVLGVMPQIWTYIPVYNPHGQFYRYEAYTNPADNLINGGLTKKRIDRFNFNVKGDLQLYEGLKFIGQMGLRWSYGEDKVSNTTWERHDWNGNVNNVANDPNKSKYSPNYRRYGSYTAYLDYNNSFFDKHHLNMMIGASHEENDYEWQSTTGYNLISNELYTLNLADRTNLAYLDISGGASDWALTSYFGRLGYNYEHKYMLDFTLRSDGSSKFSPKKRWSALFPSLSAAWNITGESFMKSFSLLNTLKLRLSWGKAGNQELSFGNYDYIPLITLNNKIIPLGSPNVGVTGATPTIASQDRTWETIETLNAGINFDMLNSRLSGSFDYFVKYNNDMLVNIELPAVLGGSAPTQNVGKLRTNGWEISLGWNDAVGEFKYGVSFTLSDAKTKMKELKGSDNYYEGLIKAREGYSLNSYFGYKSAGIIKNEQQLTEYKKLGGNVPANIGIGDMMYKDLDGDGKITAFGDDGKSGDMTYLGNVLPRYTYSSKIDLAYKQFDFGIFLQGVGKRNVIRTGNLQAPFWQAWYQPLDYFHGKTWTTDSPDAEYPRIIPGGRGFNNLRDWNWTKYSDAKINNAAYLRIKSINLGYSIPHRLLQKVKIQNLRIYVSGEDLFTISSSKGTWDGNFDPEEGWASYDHTTYPFSKVISFGVDIKF